MPISLRAEGDAIGGNRVCARIWRSCSIVARVRSKVGGTRL
jgi:hypothetical protein